MNVSDHALDITKLEVIHILKSLVRTKRRPVAQEQALRVLYGRLAIRSFLRQEEKPEDRLDEILDALKGKK